MTKNQPITLRDLMLHRRGIKFPYKPDGRQAGTAMPSHLDLLNGTGNANNPAIQLKKNTNKSGNHTYAGVLIMQQILMDHYQMDFPSLMQRYVLDPLGMSDSFFAIELSEQQLEQLAIGYGPGEKRVPGDYRRYPEMAAAGLYTTASDYARFVLHTLDATKGLENSILSKAVAAAAMLPNNTDDNLLFNQWEKEYGWGGASYGYFTQFEADAVQKDWVVVVFTNDHMNWGFNIELRNQGKHLIKQHQAQP